MRFTPNFYFLSLTISTLVSRSTCLPTLQVSTTVKANKADSLPILPTKETPVKQALPPLPAEIIANLQTRLTEKFEVATHGPAPNHTGVLTNCEIPKSAAFSYDDGIYNWSSDLDTLFKPYKGAYTKFVNGANWRPCIYDEESVQDLKASFEQGALIASHTWSHAHMNTLTHDQIDQEIESLEIALFKILGIVPRIIRPPYGECDENCASYLNKRHGYTVVTWNVDSGDSVGATPDTSIQTLTGALSSFPNPFMPLMHETYETSVKQVSPAIVPLAKKAGYDLLTVAQCLKESPYKIVAKPQKRDETWTCQGALPYKGL